MGGAAKRKRCEELTGELDRQVGTLNRAFLQWVKGNQASSPLALMDEGCKDYAALLQQLRGKLAVEGDALACGTGDCGQLGFGVEGGDADMFVNRPRAIEALKGVSVSAVACGGMHNAVACGEDGRVLTWGCADDNALGREGDENFPAPVRFPSRCVVAQLSAGDVHTAALSLRGEVFVWGAYKDKDGKNWMLGGASAADCFGRSQPSPLLVEAVSDARAHGGVTQIASGASHTLALCGDGTVFSWGVGESGQLGRKVGELKDAQGVYQKERVLREHLSPQPMRLAESGQAAGSARFVATGHYSSFVIQAMRSRCFACGLNNYGQLALDNAKGSVVHELTSVPALDQVGVAQMHGGEHHTLAVSHAGHVYAFGRADSNQLGVKFSAPGSSDAGAFTFEPQRVTGFSVPVESVFCGSFHSLAVARDGTLFTWGYGEMAQLGHGRQQDEEAPRAVQDKQGNKLVVVTAAAGAQHTVIIVK